MKRPQGFDTGTQKPAQNQKPAPSAKSTSQKPAKAPKRAAQPPQASAAAKTVATPRTASTRTPGPSARQARPDASARAELRRAARARRRFERAEVRRFTRRARTRRIALATVGGILVTLAVLVLTAVYSPILALRQITVDGTSRIDAGEVRSSIESQIGTPLALIDFGAVTRELSAFPLIRSYVTELVPPDTLLVHITERQPVGSIERGGQFVLVDPAGVTLQQSAERIPGVPLLQLGTQPIASTAFTSMVEVLVALPPELLAQVDSVSASTKDDVSLVLTGVGQGVTWGSAAESERKAALLAALIKVTDPSRAGVFDVSAPGNGVFRPS
jgi:cell division protein FtsQ